MAKKTKVSASGAKSAGKGAPKDEGGGYMDAVAEALRDAGKRASDLAQNPYARSLLAAGLVAAAAALASNKNVRDVTKRNLRAATDAVEVGADNAGKIGLAIVNAATEAVQRMLTLGAVAGGAASTGGAAKAKSSTAPKRAKPAAKAPARKAPAKSAAKPTKAATSTAKSAAAPARKAPAKTAAAKPASKSTGAAAPRKRAAPKKTG